MTRPKYKITPRMLEERGAIRQLERDGFSRETISKTMYKITDGATTQQRNEIMVKLHDRSDS